MNQNGNSTSMNYRNEIVEHIFSRIHAAESCAVVGAASVGKTRLLDFIMRSDVQKYFLEERVTKILLLRVDCNRLSELTERGLYELLLTAIIEGCLEKPETRKQYQEFNKWRSSMFSTDNHLPWLRNLELAVRILVKVEDFKLCILLDEFDDSYKNLPNIALANLRALRDANKGQFNYILFLRNVPEFIRDITESESFHELFSYFIIGLKPYTRTDSINMVTSLEERRQQQLDARVKDALPHLSGGHPGLILALFPIAVNNPEWFINGTGFDQILSDQIVIVECNKLLGSLPEVEREALNQIVQGKNPPDRYQDRLLLKGMLISNETDVYPFSPILTKFLLST